MPPGGSACVGELTGHNAGIAHRNGELWDIFTPAVRAWNRSLYARIAPLTGM